MLIVLMAKKLHAVATDGHRLSLNALDQSGFSDITPDSTEKSDDTPVHFIVPRKTIQELRKHLTRNRRTSGNRDWQSAHVGYI